jgi:alpha-methylacyl-CoA racemase
VGPLAELRVVEVASLGAGPFCAMMLADLGATVLRVERPGGSDSSMTRNRPIVTVDLKQGSGRDFVLRLATTADVLIEGFRPGVAERLGIGPAECLEANPALIYGRMTGWGQTGPLAARAGHDINYVAISGTLGALGKEGTAPAPPLNLLGDFAGGGMLLAYGILAALWERQASGAGQVIDAAMVDGAALLATMVHELAAAGSWQPGRGTNLLDGGAPFYDTYACSDGRWLAVGALEPQFFAELVATLGIDFALDRQYDREAWPALRRQLAAVFGSKTRDEWETAFASGDACVTPVLSLAEAADHRANRDRGVFVDVDGVVTPAPAPRFSRSAADPPRPGGAAARLEEWGFSAAEVEALASAGIS